MGIFISWQKIYECIAVSVLFTALFCATTFKLLGILQSSGYSTKKLFGWTRQKNNTAIQRRVMLFMLMALAYAVLALCFSFTGKWSAIIGLLAFVKFFVLFIIANKRIALRVPLTATPRLKRLTVILFLVAGALVYASVTMLNYADMVLGNIFFKMLRYLPLSLFPLLSLPIIAVANFLSKGIEVPRNHSFVRKAKNRLAKSNLTVIAITGSYGKTSTKMILRNILSQKYRVLSTPRSHNTPMGLALTINKNDLEDFDILIAEMGARRTGDISELCEMCPPDYSAITGICSQHLESFLTEENIVKAKGEILTATKKCAVLAAEVYPLYYNYFCRKYKVDCLSDVVTTPDGTDFTLTLNGEQRRAHTKLLGKHNAENIALAATLANLIGMTIDEIVEAIAELDFVEHRLQLIKSNGVNILDDGYNSNVRGAAAALEVLRSFEGRKVVVTPGLVELGYLEESENQSLGEKLKGFDLVILVGETLIAPVKKGYLDTGGDPARLKVVPTLARAQQELKLYLNPGDTVLFLNDLPDVY